MWPVLFRIGGAEITVFAIAAVAEFVVGSFWLWKRMRDEYDEEDILVLTVVLAVVAVIGAYVSHWLVYQNWGVDLWGAVVAVIGALYVWCVRSKWHFWEWFDRIGQGELIVLVIGGLAWGRQSLMFAAGMAVGVIVVGWLAKNYRQLKWYKSGKSGLIGLAALMWWSGVELVVANFVTQSVYLARFPIESWIALAVLIAGTSALYIRSGRKLNDELKNVWQKTHPTKK